MDSEGLLQCPYDKSHMIRPGRFPFHLVKCRENNKDVAKKLATCPFNARHRVPKKELELHMQTCENKCPLEPLPAFKDVNYETAVKSKAENLSSWQSPPCGENWEEDLQTGNGTFVLKEYGNYCPYDAHETASDSYTPSATAQPSQGGYINSGKPTVTSKHTWGTYPDGASATHHSKPGNSYENEWPSATAQPSQGAHIDSGKPTVTNKHPWGTYPDGANAANHAKPGNSYKNEWPSATARPSQGAHTDSGKPTVTNKHPWGTYPDGASATHHSKPGNSYENEWPRLENRTGKERRQFK